MASFVIRIPEEPQPNDGRFVILTSSRLYKKGGPKTRKSKAGVQEWIARPYMSKEVELYSMTSKKKEWDRVRARGEQPEPTARPVIRTRLERKTSASNNWLKTVLASAA